MCNAWNHSYGCNCGWGGGGSRGSRLSTARSTAQVSTNTSSPVSMNQNQFMNFSRSVQDISIPKNFYEKVTYSRSCRNCGADVWIHTNGDGGWVLFDTLGYPWPIHSCFAIYWEEEKKKRSTINSQATCQPKSVVQKYLEACDQSHSYTMIPAQTSRTQRVAVLTGIFEVVSKNSISRVVDEFTLAASMKTTILNLRNWYGDLYVIEASTGSVKILEDEDSSRKPKIKPQVVRVVPYQAN